MIWESWSWKLDLAKRADKLGKRKKQRRWTEQSFALTEQDLFFSAYAIRKLLEAKKLSDEMESTILHASCYQSRAGVADIMNWHRVDEKYNLSGSTDIEIGLREFCNQVIHSFVFVLSFGDDSGLDGFLVASDHKRRRQLLYFEIDEVISALRLAAKDDIQQSTMHRDERTGEMKITKNSNLMFTRSGE